MQRVIKINYAIKQHPQEHQTINLIKKILGMQMHQELERILVRIHQMEITQIGKINPPIIQHQHAD
jgi:hypothetical protein